MVEVAPLAGIVVALLVLLLTLAVLQFAKALAQFVPSWHIPGFGNLRDTVNASVAAAQAAIRAQLAHYAIPFAKFLAQPVFVLQTLFSTITNTVAGLANRVYQVAHVQVPAQLSAIRVLIARNVATLNAAIAEVHRQADVAVAHNVIALRNLIASNVATLSAAIAEVHRQADVAVAHNVIALRSWIALNVAGIETRIADARAELLAALSHNVLALRHAIAAALVQALHYADAIGAKAIAYTDAAVKAGELAVLRAIDATVGLACLPLWPAVIDAAEGIERAAEGAFTDTLTDLRKLERAVPRTLAGQITGVLTLTLTLARFTRDCVVPNCRNLSQVGRDLQALFGVVEDGLLFAFIAECAANPQAVAREVHDVLVPVLNEAASDAASVFGVAA